MSNVHFDCAGSHSLGALGGCFQRLRSRCGAARIFANGGRCSWQAQGKPRALVLQSRLFVTGARDRSCFLRNAGFAVWIVTFGRVARLQISWQAQHLVNLEVQISWQVQHLVKLEAQISWQAQHFVNLAAQIS